MPTNSGKVADLIINGLGFSDRQLEILDKLHDIDELDGLELVTDDIGRSTTLPCGRDALDSRRDQHHVQVQAYVSPGDYDVVKVTELLT